jgi:hypothetical protein
MSLVFHTLLPNQIVWQVTRVNSTNVPDEGLRIEGIGRRMNSKVNQSKKAYIESKRGGRLCLLPIYP